MQTVEAVIGSVVDARMAEWFAKIEALLKAHEKPEDRVVSRIAVGRQEIFNAKEAAKILGCSDATVRKLIREGVLLTVTDGTSTIYKIPREEIEKFIYERKTSGSTRSTSRGASSPAISST